MKEILAIFVLNKAVNAMTDTKEKNLWFRIFRASFWLGMTVATFSVMAWIVAFAMSSIRALP